MKHDRTSKAFQELKEYGRVLLLQAYQNMGVLRNTKEAYQIDQIGEIIGISVQYKNLNRTLLEILEDAGYITIENGQIKTTELVYEVKHQVEHSEEIFDRISNEYTEIKDYLCLLKTCVSNYKDIFCGTVKATDILFKQSGELVGKVYGGNQFTDYFNMLIADAVGLYVEQKHSEDNTAKIRILEIGAGTGGTTKKVLPALAGYDSFVEYTFTDISNSFLIQAEDLFEEKYPFVTYKILDIEKEIEEQFDTFGKQDIIICSNVLHATKNIMVTLAHIQKLLKKAGWLILNELVEPMEYTTMTFGLLDGWWLSEDKELRLKNSPLLSADRWISCLQQLDFVDAMILGDTETAQAGIKQNVIIAENNKDVKLGVSKVERNSSTDVVKTNVATDQSDIYEYVHKKLIHCMKVTLRLKSEENYNDAMTFWDYGVDSILVNRIISKMNDELGITLDNQDLFSYGSMEKLVPYVVDRFGKEIKQHSDIAKKEVHNVESTKIQEPSVVENKSCNNLNLDDIAVIGMSCKLPKANNVTELWHNLKSGIDCVTEIPNERWNAEEYFNDNKEVPGTYNCKYGAFLSDIDCFEPMFFNISPKQAEIMDPRQRLFLEQAYKSVEDAGYSQKELAGKSVGVFVGCEGDSEYLKNKMMNAEEYSSQLFLGNSNSVLASRISYFMDWKGPSITVDTACSSSSIAIHLACQSLKLEECDMAIAGGVHLCVKPDGYIMLSKMEMLSEDGSCKAFDNNANGFVPGEGVGVVMLKPLSKAKQDGDHIYCVIKASGMNQDGKSNGIMAPNMLSQYELEKRVYEKNHIDPATIQYIETHGTGTKIGDPMEFEALKEAFGPTKKKSCGLGSIKTYIGHLGPASGIASLIKVILQLQHKEFISNLHYNQINETIEIENSPFYICNSNEPWNVSDGEIRRAALNAFGHSGTNCHIIIDEYVEEKRKITRKPAYLFHFSAFTEASLLEYLYKFRNWLQENREVSLFDLSYTMNVGRTKFQTRACVIVSDWQELYDQVGHVIEQKEYIHNTQPSEYRKEEEREAKQIIETLTKEALDEKDYMANLYRLRNLVNDNPAISLVELYKESECRRISIPSYCFQKKKYWLKENKTSSKNKTEYKINSMEAQKGVLYKSEWKKKSDQRSFVEVPKDKLLVFVKENQLEKVQQEIPNAIYVVSGNCFLNIRQDTYTIRMDAYEDYQSLANMITHKFSSGVTVLHLWSYNKAESMDDCLSYGIYSVFWFTKCMMESKYSNPVRLLYAYESKEPSDRPECKAMTAFIETIYLEHPRYDYRSVELSYEMTQEEKKSALLGVLNHWGEEMFLRYDKSGSYYREQSVYMDLNAPLEESNFKPGAVYLITGGAGGIGKIIASAMVGCRVVLTGRSQMNDSIRETLSQLNQNGVQACYITADISRRDKVEMLVNQIHQEFGSISGIFHSAGVFRNGFVLNKKMREIQDVFDPKIYGTLWLDESLKDENLDFFVMFSSISAIFGKIGQSDYAYANSFMDNFASYRELLVQKGMRFGKSLSINWPYWAEGGMHISQEEKAEIGSDAGLEPMPSVCGVKGMELALRAPYSQSILMYGEDRYQQAQILNHRFDREMEQDETNEVDESDVRDYVDQLVCDILMDEICSESEEIDKDISFDCYGFDSIVVNHFNSKIGKQIEHLSKTVLYECNTINELIDYIVSNHKDQILEKLKRQNSTKHLEEKKQEVQEIQKKVRKIQEIQQQDRWNVGIETQEANIHSSIQTDSKGVEKKEYVTKESIAIIGLDGKYPDADDVTMFWENLSKGKDSIRDIPLERWDYRNFYDPDPVKAEEGKIYCKSLGALQGVDEFDSRFFKILPSEAELMDPQERLFLESAYRAMEDAGYTRQSLNDCAKKNDSEVGVFAGVTSNSYQLFAPSQWEKGNPTIPAALPWSVANRISYLFNLHGPSIPVDTACSSSLSAIHLACNSLKHGECNIAIAGGVNIQCHPEAKYKYLCQLGMLSKQGRCASFSEDADGFVPGEGVGTIILKPLSKAVEDGDHIYGLILGSAMNHGGKTSGYTVPNPNAQAEVIKQALEDAGVDARTIGCIETHGTGTALGDPIEITGITKAFDAFTDNRQFCSIASLKANIGHLESASGIASITKILLQMKYKKLAPSIHINKLNERIDFEHSPVYVQQHLADWIPYREEIAGTEVTHKRRAGVSSFGAGGVNVHIILEEYEDTNIKDSDSTNDKYIAVFSGNIKESLSNRFAQFKEFLAEQLTINNMPQTEGVKEYIQTLFKQMKMSLQRDQKLSTKIFREQQALEDIKKYGRYLMLHKLKSETDVLENNLTIKTWKQKLRVISEYEKIFDAMLQVLINGTFICIDGEEIVVQETMNEFALDSKVKELRFHLRENYSEIAGMEALCKLLDVCVDSILQVMSGSVHYADVMFKDGEMDLVQNIYKGNCIVDYFNDIASDTIYEMVKRKVTEYPNRLIRILEIGAGTGSTTTFVLPKLAEFSEQIQLVYTDISMGFTNHGKRTFGKMYPFVKFKQLDISEDIQKQGFTEESFDLVYACNVLHATRDIRETLRNVHQLMRKDALLVLNELTKVQEYGTLTFGLTNGWWAYEDELRLKHSPLLNVENWSRAMENCGLSLEGFYELPMQLQGDLNHCILVAKNKLNAKNDWFERMIYTLQLGREPMNYRAAFVVKTPEELLQSIEEYVAEGNCDGGYISKEKIDQNKRKSISTQQMSDYMNQKQLDCIASDWVNGCEIPWEMLYGTNLPKRISLPTYKFDHRRYWFGGNFNGKPVTRKQRKDHEVLIEASDPFLLDHKVKENSILPGAYMIELALATGSKVISKEVTAIKDMYFYSPVSCVNQESKTLQVELQDDTKEKQLSIIDTQGTLTNMTCELVEGDYDRQITAVDIEELLGQCNHFMNGKECYQRFKESGFYYGPMYQSLKQLYYGEEISVAEIRVSDENDRKGREMCLHPSLMDAAFQAVLGFNQQEEAVYVPYYIEKLELRKRPEKHCFSIAAKSKEYAGIDKKYNIKIVDCDGEVCVVVTGFSLRSYQNNTQKKFSNDIVFCTQIWEEKEM